MKNQDIVTFFEEAIADAVRDFAKEMMGMPGKQHTHGTSIQSFLPDGQRASTSKKKTKLLGVVNR